MRFKLLQHPLLLILGIGFILTLSFNQSICQAKTKELPAWQVYLNQAKTQQLAGDTQGAQNAYQYALVEGEHLYNKEQIDFWFALQDFYALQKNYETRQVILEKMQAAQDQLATTSPMEKAHTDDLLGQNLTQLNAFDQAEKHFKSALKAIEEEQGTSSKDLYPILDHLSELYTKQNKPELVTAIIQKKDNIKNRLAICPDDSQFTDYINAINKTIKSNWKPPAAWNDNKIIIRFRLFQNGSIDRLNVTSSSKNNEVDKAALMAVEVSRPFPPLPFDCHDFVTVQFIFEYQLNQPIQSPFFYKFFAL